LSRATSETIPSSPAGGPAVPRRGRCLVWLGLGLLVLFGIGGAVAFQVWSRPDPERLKEQAQKEFERKNYALAEVLLSRALRHSAPDARDWMLLAQFAMIHHHDDEALANLAKVPDTHPLAAQAWYQRGRIERVHNRIRAAEEAYRHALDLDARATKPKPLAPEHRISARRELIYIYGMQLRREEMSAEFEALAELTPLGFHDIFNWCLIQGVVWDPAEVKQTLGKFLAADPSDRHSRLALAESLRQLNEFDQAEKTLAPLPVDDPDALAIRVRIAQDRGDGAAVEALLAQGPADHPVLARFRGRQALQRQDGPAALRHLRLAYAADSHNRDTLFLLAQALRMVGQPEEAKRYAEDARKHDVFNSMLQIAAGPHHRQDPKFFRRFGDACAAIGRYPVAKAWYKLAIVFDPLNPEYQQALYRVETTMVETKAAIESQERNAR
jgi:tetratricopeptide (TPR) repeat protein